MFDAHARQDKTDETAWDSGSSPIIKQTKIRENEKCETKHGYRN